MASIGKHWQPGKRRKRPQQASVASQMARPLWTETKKKDWPVFCGVVSVDSRPKKQKEVKAGTELRSPLRTSMIISDIPVIPRPAVVAGGRRIGRGIVSFVA